MSLLELDKEAVFRLRARMLLTMGRNIGVAGDAGVDPERTRPGNDLPYESHRTSFDHKIVLITAAFLALLLALLLLHCLLRYLLRRLRHHPSSSNPTSAPHPHPMKLRHIRSLPSSTFHPLISPHVAKPASPHCPICLADFADGDLIRLLPPCHHGFHASCLDLWLLRQATCPTCRADLLIKGACTPSSSSSSSLQVHLLITPPTSAHRLPPTLNSESGEPKHQVYSSPAPNPRSF